MQIDEGMEERKVGRLNSARDFSKNSKRKGTIPPQELPTLWLLFLPLSLCVASASLKTPRNIQDDPGHKIRHFKCKAGLPLRYENSRQSCLRQIFFYRNLCFQIYQYISNSTKSSKHAPCRSRKHNSVSLLHKIALPACCADSRLVVCYFCYTISTHSRTVLAKLIFEFVQGFKKQYSLYWRFSMLRDRNN